MRAHTATMRASPCHPRESYPVTKCAHASLLDARAVLALAQGLGRLQCALSHAQKASRRDLECLCRLRLYMCTFLPGAKNGCGPEEHHVWWLWCIAMYISCTPIQAMCRLMCLQGPNPWGQQLQPLYISRQDAPAGSTCGDFQSRIAVAMGVHQWPRKILQSAAAACS